MPTLPVDRSTQRAENGDVCERVRHVCSIQAILLPWQAYQAGEVSTNGPIYIYYIYIYIDIS